jgi:hypothetical protein
MSKNIKLQCKDCNDNLTDCTCIEDTVDMKQEPGKETADYIDRHIVEAVVEVAKQKMYSEEELKSAFKIGFNIGYGSPVQELDLKNKHCDKWFEQFKKK